MVVEYRLLGPLTVTVSPYKSKANVKPQTSINVSYTITVIDTGGP